MPTPVQLSFSIAYRMLPRALTAAATYSAFCTQCCAFRAKWPLPLIGNTQHKQPHGSLICSTGSQNNQIRRNIGGAQPHPAGSPTRRKRPERDRDFLDEDFDIETLLTEQRISNRGSRTRSGGEDRLGNDRKGGGDSRERGRRRDGGGRYSSTDTKLPVQEQRGQGLATDVGEEDAEAEGVELPPIEYREESFRTSGDRIADDYFFSRKDFSDLGLSDEAIGSLQELGISRPSKIQTIACPHVSQGTTCIIAEQTGSGKTIAYLLPLLQRARELEQQGGLGRAQPNKPRVVILTPTAELAVQVMRVARIITRHLPLRVGCMTGGQGDRTQRDFLKQGIDVVVGTPGRIQYFVEQGMLSLSDLKALVLDEVDVMLLDESFDLRVIGRNAPLDTQFVFVTATLPVSVAQQVAKEFPGVKKLWGPGLHKIAPQVEEILVDCSGPYEEEKNEDTAFQRKRDMLLRNLAKEPVPRTLVFCNSIPTCRKVENALSRADRRGKQYRVLAYHSALSPQDRQDNLKSFTRAVPAFQPVILVCTDRTSRGMDFDTADVEHVVLFDFPRDPSEYVRRVGRTGRAGRGGKVTALVLGRQVGLARSIMSGNAKGDRVHPVPS